MRKLNHRDFIRKGSQFYAVLSTNPLICCLRYVQIDGVFKKVDGEIVIIDNINIDEVLSGKERLKEIMSQPKDPYEEDVYNLAKFLSRFVDIENLGISGSGLVKCHRVDSDIDFVVYGMENFNKAREAIKKEINKGVIKNLNLEQWKELYSRRIFKNELTFDEFLWHEKRKFNKGVIKNRRFDILLSEDVKINLNFKKIGSIKKRGKVVKANPFSYPAYYEIVENELIKILCWTHTYVGQAFEGDEIEVCGMLEEINNEKFIIVGTSRKAIGEYIKVKNLR